MPLSPKSRLGTYEILGPLGSGGMGEVYRAKDLRLGREIAIKVLPTEVASSPDRLARFEREARTVAGLNHPNIVVLHSVEDEDGVRFLTMELVEGQTLSTLVSPGGLPLPRLLELAVPLTDALVAAHEKGVVHRDLKPGNVMVTREGRVKVLDFGLAKMIGTNTPAAQDATFTAAVGDPISGEGHAVGTVPYMAPEQLRGETVDARSDLFSLGIILYELATGRRPFTGETSIDVSHAILRGKPEPLGRVRADLPGDLERIVSRCLEKNPRERAQSALDVNNELRRLQRSMEREGSERPASEKVASIAVLPFVNRSRDEADEYFSDGLADELLNLLAKIRGLRVAARASSFTFRGKDEDLAVIGRKLNVATLLDGSVRKAGNRVRIAVQLINVSDGYHLWSETYDRTLEDIFAVQDDIAQAVVQELRTTLLGESPDAHGSGRVKKEVAMAAKGRGQVAEAHQLALQGRHMLGQLSPNGVTRGIGYLKEAVRLDPNNAVAWVDLSRAHLNAAGHGWESAETGLAAARDAARQALAIEPDLPEGHVMLGRIQLYFEWDWKGAAVSYRRAMELAPGNAVGLHGAGILATNEGRIDEALSLYRRAVEQDPLGSGGYARLGFGYLTADRPADAEAALRKAIDLAPERIVVRSHLALALLAQGRLTEALAEAEAEREAVYRCPSLAAVHYASGRAEEADAAIRRLVETESSHAGFQVAEAYGGCARKDEAFEWLDRAFAQRDPGLAEIKGSTLLRSLHGDPRWGAFLNRMRLDP